MKKQTEKLVRVYDSVTLAASKKITSFKSKYNKGFHSKWYSTPIYTVLITLSLVGVLFLNISYMQGGQYTFKQSFYVLGNWNPNYDHFTNPIGLSKDDFTAIHKGWYNVISTAVAGIGMTLAAVATQSLTRNPMAEGSTLGLVQAGIFGVVLAASLGVSGLFMKYVYTIILASAGAGLLLIFIVFSKRSGSSTQKVILAGLAIGVIFKTISFIVKSGNDNLNARSFAYVLGGAESISNLPLAVQDSQMATTMIVSSSLVAGGTLIAIINVKGMNLLEIGDERAKNLGSSVIRTRILNVIVVLLALPAAVILVGNMAFLGLFAVHSARWVMRSRNYKKVLPASIIIGILMASFGMQLSQHIPTINSGIWMTFIGAPYLMYIGIRGLK